MDSSETAVASVRFNIGLQPTAAGAMLEPPRLKPGVDMAAWARHIDNEYTVRVKFAWGPTKATENLEKHGVDFREAATVFDDPLSTTFPDVDHSEGEQRFLIIGLSALGRILVVSHTDTRDTIRIISARATTRREQKFYEENSSNPH